MRYATMVSLGLAFCLCETANAQAGRRNSRPRVQRQQIPQTQNSPNSSPRTPEEQAALSEHTRRLTNPNEPDSSDLSVRVKLAREGYVYIEEKDAYFCDPQAAHQFLRELYRYDGPVASNPRNVGGGYFGGPAYDLSDVADFGSGQRKYADGPNGPGAYQKERWYQWHLAQRRGGQLQDANRVIVDEGMRFFRAGDFERAAITWLRASTLDEGDAASRLAAGHALFAIGRYPEATQLLARAFELTPQIASLSYDIRHDYAQPHFFDQHLSILEQHVAANPNDYESRLLLGYVLSYSHGPSHGYDHLRYAMSVHPEDTFAQKLWDTAKLIGPATQPPRQYRSQPPRVSPQPQRIDQMRPVTPTPSRGVKNRSQPPIKKSEPEPGKMRLVKSDQ